MVERRALNRCDESLRVRTLLQRSFLIVEHEGALERRIGVPQRQALGPTGHRRPCRARLDVYVATLTRGDFASTEQLLPTLDQVRIGKLTGNDFVLLGLEDLSHRKVSAVYPQAWWCHARPDPAGVAAPFDAGDKI